MKTDLTALCSFRYQQDAFWKALLHPTTPCLVFVVAICGVLALLQLFANVVGRDSQMNGIPFGHRPFALM
jgi:hypothetical protein